MPGAVDLKRVSACMCRSVCGMCAGLTASGQRSHCLAVRLVSLAYCVMGCVCYATCVHVGDGVEGGVCICAWSTVF